MPPKGTKPMAELTDRNHDNAPGAFYTDDTCIICGQCSEIAPNVFRESDDGGYNIVYQQPSTEDDCILAEEAMETCPTESIGDDGKECVVA